MRSPWKGGSISRRDRKSTRLNSRHVAISYAVFCLKKKTGWRIPSGAYSTRSYTNVTAWGHPTFVQTITVGADKLIAGCEEPTSGLEPLTCSLRVITQALQGVARDCKSPISKRLSLLRVAACCTVLRSRWYRNGISPLRIGHPLVPHPSNA